ncbi:MYND domain protein [Rutstroemia sp. NJR-2017a WRK4]|nr:MYND domain protein [Rutstroemia sp. NJR-2017a WRK4]
MCKIKSNPASNPTATSRHNPGFESINMVLGLENDDYLHKMPEKDVYSQLIDCFRLRAEDELNFAGNIRGIYDGEDPRPVFKEFLDFAESRDKILPRWWNNEKRALCEKMAVEDNWYNINSVVEKSDIMEHYKDNMMPMKLRILAEKIYGKGFM